MTTVVLLRSAIPDALQQEACVDITGKVSPRHWPAVLPTPRGFSHLGSRRMDFPSNYADMDHVRTTPACFRIDHGRFDYVRLDAGWVSRRPPNLVQSTSCRWAKLSPTRDGRWYQEPSDRNPAADIAAEVWWKRRQTNESACRRTLVLVVQYHSPEISVDCR